MLLPHLAQAGPAVRLPGEQACLVEGSNILSKEELVAAYLKAATSQIGLPLWLHVVPSPGP